jgi:hypothetical protein
MQKLDLSDVTMVCIDDVNTEKAIRVLGRLNYLHLSSYQNDQTLRLFIARLLKTLLTIAALS